MTAGSNFYFEQRACNQNTYCLLSLRRLIRMMYCVIFVNRCLHFCLIYLKIYHTPWLKTPVSYSGFAQDTMKDQYRLCFSDDKQY